MPGVVPESLSGGRCVDRLGDAATRWSAGLDLNRIHWNCRILLQDVGVRPVVRPAGQSDCKQDEIQGETARLAGAARCALPACASGNARGGGRTCPQAWGDAQRPRPGFDRSGERTERHHEVTAKNSGRPARRPQDPRGVLMGSLKGGSAVASTTASRGQHAEPRRSRHPRRSRRAYTLRVASPYAEVRTPLTKPASEMTAGERRNVINAAHRRLWRRGAGGQLVARLPSAHASPSASGRAPRPARRGRSGTVTRRRGGRDPDDPAGEPGGGRRGDLVVGRAADPRVELRGSDRARRTLFAPPARARAAAGRSGAGLPVECRALVGGSVLYTEGIAGRVRRCQSSARRVPLEVTGWPS